MEFALTAPIVFLFVFASIDISRAITIRNTADNAAYEGARKGITPGATPEQVMQVVTDTLGIFAIKDAEITITPSTITEDTAAIQVDILIPLGSNLFAKSSWMTKHNVSSSCILSRERTFE